VLVNNAKVTIGISDEHLSDTRILQVLLAYAMPHSGSFGDLLGMEAHEIRGDSAGGSQKLNFNPPNFNPHLGSTREIFALAAQHDQASRLRAFRRCGEDGSDVSVISLPLFRLLGRKKVPKSAHGIFNLSRTEGRG
jgi:hypothetical protein